MTLGAMRELRRVGWAALAAAVLVSCTPQVTEPVAEPTTTPVTSQPEAEPEPTVEPEPTTNPPGSVPDRPAAMDDPGDEGAIAAAEYFAQLVYLAYMVDSTDELEAMSNVSCNFCSSIVRSADDLAESGNRYVGGEARLLGRTEIVGREETLGVVGVLVPMAIEEAHEWGTDGNLVESWEAGEFALYLEMTHTYLGWLVVGGAVQ